MNRATSRRYARPALLLAAGALVVVLAFRGWDRWVEDRLARWAMSEVARRTGGAYRLVLGDLSFLPLAGTVAFDSAVVTTDTVRNRRRQRPLPVLRGHAHDCRVAGVDVLQLAFRSTFAARELECERVETRLELPVRPGRAGEFPGDSADTSDPPENLRRPLGLSSIRVAELSLPALRFALERPDDRGGTSLLLERARFMGEDLWFDPTVTPGEQRSFSAARARLTASGLVVRTDGTELTVAGLDADLVDSTLRVADVRHEPPIAEDEWARRVRVRRDRVRFAVDSARARGVAFRAFIAGGGMGARTVELDGARLDVLSDRRIPRGRPSRHPTPQGAAAETDPPLRLDSVLVRGGTIVYRERKPGSGQPGRVSFDAIRATILHLHLPSTGEPLEIAGDARLMGEGPLTVRASVPLDAPHFRYELSGRLGPMPATAFNAFLARNEAFALDGGTVESIVFRQTVRHGRATTTATPRYRNLSVEPTGDGGGLFGSVKRAVEEFVAQALVVRSSNPGEEGESPRTGRTVLRYDPTLAWTRFLWLGLRGALMEALKE